jgi:hypothetical protein
VLAVAHAGFRRPAFRALRAKAGSPGAQLRKFAARATRETRLLFWGGLLF